MIARPPRSRTIRGRFFFNRAQRDLGRGDDLVDVVGRLRELTGLGQEPGDVEIGLSPRLLMHLAFHGGEASWVGGQAPEPLGLAFHQQSSGLVGDLGR